MHLLASYGIVNVVVKRALDFIVLLQTVQVELEKVRGAEALRNLVFYFTVYTVFAEASIQVSKLRVLEIFLIKLLSSQ